MKRKFTTEQFIQKAKEIHGDKYDYSKTEYVTMEKKILIICPEHGEFWQRPHLHLSHSNCPKCAAYFKKRNKKLTTEEFIKKAKLVHGDKYDYSLVDYKDVKTKIKIICPIHGEFQQRPYSHLSSSGCFECSNKYKGQSKKLTTEEFIRRSKDAHGNRYDYSKTEYVDSTKK